MFDLFADACNESVAAVVGFCNPTEEFRLEVKRMVIDGLR